MLQLPPCYIIVVIISLIGIMLFKSKQFLFMNVKKNLFCLGKYFSCETIKLEDVKIIMGKFGGGSIELTQEEDGIAILTINNPSKRNAFTGKMMVDLHNAIDTLENWSAGKGLIVTGATGGGFCSGGDLEFIRKHASSVLGQRMSYLMTSALKRLGALPLISVAFIENPGAYGGGAEVSIACDFRLIAPGSNIGFVHSRMGILPAWGGISHLLNHVSYNTALRLVASGCVLNENSAIKHNLADGVANNLVEAKEFLNNIVCHQSSIIRAAKIAVQAKHDTQEQGKLFVSLFGGTLNRQALSENIKFVEKK